ncbi:MAG: hypothetical protein A2X02_08560 [Bacteroidetes bacterium GWF2_29_10]|nr:MAG: hypothetical protein A2X02_08560 [Bacteroidetes bacterium GWF2_29_10]
MAKRNYALYSTNIIAILIYVVVFFNLKITVSEEIMFSTLDAGSYKDVQNWLEHGVDSENVSTRPLLYPLLLMTTSKLGGVYGIWIVQVIFWLLSINFTFMTINYITKNNLLSFIGAFFFMSNLSLIALTLHALTEVTTVFLLSMMLFLLARKIEEYRSLRFFHICLFFMVLLTILKPVFYIPLLSLLFIVLPLFYLKKYLKYPLNILILLLIILPVIVQITIIKTKYGEAKVSLISSKTLSNYLVSQGMEKIESISFESAVKKSNSLSQKQQIYYIKNHLFLYSYLFKGNIVHNIRGVSFFLLYPDGYEKYRLSLFMKHYNNVMLILHCIFLIFIFPLIFIFIKSRNFSILIFLVFFSILEFYYIFVTGISFWQGDRLTLPAIAIWSCIYPIILFYYLKILYPTSNITNCKIVSKS